VVNATTDETTSTPIRRLERARSGRMLAGVCEGLGRYFEVDPVIFRIGFAVAAIAGGAGVLAYVIAVLVIPEEGSRRAIVNLGRHTPTWVPWLLLGLGFLALVDGFDHRRFTFGWGVFVLAGAGWLIWSHEQKHERVRPVDRPTSQASGRTELVEGAIEPDREADREPEPEVEPRPKSVLGRLTLSVLLVGAGVGLLVAQGNDVTGVDVEAFFGGALLVVGAALMIGAWWGRARALIALGVLFTIAAACASVVDVPLRGGIGDRVWEPTAVVRPAYRLGIGDSTLDLTRVTADDIDTDVSVGIGHLRVVVPSDATVDVDAHAGAGQLHVLGRVVDGTDLDESVHSRGGELGKTITLDVRIGVGQLEVVRDAA
jgi:phage shock protein PspC (stress-responsive transcriptional regulator)